MVFMVVKKSRAIWLSDVHLGTRDAKSEYLLDFLRRNESEYLYLVGDILDFWKIRSKWFWPAINNEIVDLVLHKAKTGTKVIYIPGNHDDVLRKYSNCRINGVRILAEAIHETADGRKFLILHGDEFDLVSTYSKWLAKLGSDAYQFLLSLNRFVNFFRRKMGKEYWSLSAYLKHKVKEAVNFIGNFEKSITAEAKRRKVDGLICGHIHHAAFAQMSGVFYRNIGDWVESCTALVENAAGNLQIVRWAEQTTVLYDERSLILKQAPSYANYYRNGRLASTS